MTIFADAGKPPAVKSPCNECPWRRNARPGFLGPHTAEEWARLAHTDTPIACHKTIKRNLDWVGALQCAGAAIFRRNVGKSPRDPAVAVGPLDTERVFRNDDEFVDHHERRKESR